MALFQPIRAWAQITVATSLSSFEGKNYPQVIYDPTTQTFSSNPYTNTVDEGNQGDGEIFRFTLRYYPTPQTAWPGYPSTFWDGNLDVTSGSSSTDRQRDEVEGLGPYQVINTTYQYSFNFETDPNFIGTSGWCHIFQLKGLDSTGADPGYDPVVTLSLSAKGKGELELYSPDGDGDQITIARTFTYTPNTWENAVIDITPSATDGSVMASINGDAMQGVSDVPVDITGLYTYRPKWGFYREIDNQLFNGINYMQDEDITADALFVPLTWTNASSNNLWDNSTSSNWNNGVNNAVFYANNTVTFNDTNNGSYQVTLNTTVNPASVTVSNNTGNYSIIGSGKIVDTGSFTKSGTGSLTLDTSLTAASLSITAGALKLAANATLGSGNPTSNVNISSLSITGNGVLDITNNHIIITYGASDPLTTIAGYIKTGFNSGHWNGVGIISSAAQSPTSGLLYGVGFADGNDKIVSGLTSGEIELKYTLLGDANLDGTVNGADFSILAGNFGQGYTNWDQGNFLFTPAINGADFSALAANFGQGDNGADSVSPADIAALQAFAAANGLLADVPEPNSLATFLCASSLMIRRRTLKYKT